MRPVRFLPAVMLALILAACGDGPSLESYQQIENDMSRDAVIALLGEPDRSETVGIAGVTGAHAAWETDEFVISVQFVNGRVISKQFITVE